MKTPQVPSLPESLSWKDMQDETYLYIMNVGYALDGRSVEIHPISFRATYKEAEHLMLLMQSNGFGFSWAMTAPGWSDYYKETRPSYPESTI